MCSFCVPKFIPTDGPPMTFQVSFVPWWFFRCSFGLFYFRHSYRAKLYRVTNLCILRVQSGGCCRAFPELLSVFLLLGTGPRHCWFRRLWPVLGFLRSNSLHSRIILARPYIVSELSSLLLLHIQGNVWKPPADFFVVSMCWNSLFQLLERLSMEIVGRDCRVSA